MKHNNRNRKGNKRAVILVTQIDMLPLHEDGMWVVREEVYDNQTGKAEQTVEHKFVHKADAQKFIDSWVGQL
jgi:hypothetical protein